MCFAGIVAVVPGTVTVSDTCSVCGAHMHRYELPMHEWLCMVIKEAGDDGRGSDTVRAGA